MADNILTLDGLIFEATKITKEAYNESKENKNVTSTYLSKYNPDFWKNYSDLVATGVVGKALKDLESKSSLEEQFRSKD